MLMSELYQKLKQAFPGRTISVKFEITTWSSGNEETECSLYVSPWDVSTGASKSIAASSMVALSQKLETAVYERNLAISGLKQGCLDKDVKDLETEEEEYDCPIHGKCGGIDECPKC